MVERSQTCVDGKLEIPWSPKIVVLNLISWVHLSWALGHWLPSRFMRWSPKWNSIMKCRWTLSRERWPSKPSPYLLWNGIHDSVVGLILQACLAGLSSETFQPTIHRKLWSIRWQLSMLLVSICQPPSTVHYHKSLAWTIQIVSNQIAIFRYSPSPSMQVAVGWVALLAGQFQMPLWQLRHGILKLWRCKAPDEIIRGCLLGRWPLVPWFV